MSDATPTARSTDGDALPRPDDEDLEAYRSWLAAEERYKPDTIDQYLSAARNYTQFLEARDRSVSLESYRAWLEHLVDTLKPSSVNTYHAMACKFYDWLDVDVDPSRAAGTLPNYDPDALPDPLSREQVRAMHEAARTPEERYVVIVLYHTALRNSEFRDLQWDDIDWSKRELSVRRRKKKGWGRDTLPLFDAQMTVLEDLRAWREDDNPYLLPKSSGTVSPGSTALAIEPDGKRSDGGLQNRVGAIARAAGIDRHVWPHLFRHTRLTHMLEEGKDLTEVNEWADHEKMETTMRYARLTGATLRDVGGADTSYVFQDDPTGDDEESRG